MRRSWLTLPFSLLLRAQDEYAGSKVCAGCHTEIARRYASSPMARTSGIASQANVRPGEITHVPSGANYRISGRIRVDFSREARAGSRDAAVFIGSGASARTFAWASDGFLFELPVTWYASRGWDMSPGYEKTSAVNIARPIEPECLSCHATGVRHRAGTQNGYQEPPFSEPGIGCERCHGPGKEHAARAGQGRIVNPAKLAPRLRDSVCQQCHLTGVERIFRAGRNALNFRPGQDFSGWAVVFVSGSAGAATAHVTSHYERLEISKCKLASGSKLWCGTCHDAHGAPSNHDVKCRSCHAGGKEHYTAQSECGSCHMPRVAARDVPHASLTDHSISKDQPAATRDEDVSLRPLSGEAEARELGLAWARVASSSQREPDFERAIELLREAHAAGAQDAYTLIALAYLEDRTGSEERALSLYEEARKLEPHQPEVLVNLGSTYATRGRLREALTLWKQAVRSGPGLESGWIKLVSAFAALGQTEQAVDAARQALHYHPDSTAIHEILTQAQR
jgi:Flp pilus assembly protein TadD